MATELRKTGINVVGDMPWGTHYCLFYETKQDLLDILVPYFKTGLENNEYCLWVVSNSELMSVEDAKAALKQAVPDLDRRLADENIEILNGADWYLKENVFNLERVTSAWDARLKQALAREYDGLRVSGDTFWLAEKDWKDFYAYENQLNDSITDRPMTVLCTYPLAKSGAAEVLDIVQTHQFVIARRQGEWKVIASPELLQAKAEIKRLNQALHRFKERTPRPPVILSYGVAVLSVSAALIIAQWMESVLQSAAHVSLFLCAVMLSAWFGGVRPGLLAIALSLLAFAYILPPNYSLTVETREIPRLLVFAVSALFVGSLSAAQRSVAESLRRARDVLDRTVQALKRTNEALQAENSERKRAEALLHAKEQEFRAIVENAPDQIIRYDREFRRAYVNPAVAKAYGLPVEAFTGKPVGSAIREAGLDVKENEMAQFRQRVADVFATGTSYEYEMNWIMPAGRRYYSVRLFPEFDLNGSVINVLGIARDITERKRAEDDLRAQTELLQTIFDHIPVMISFYDADGRIKLVNREYERTLGWSLEEIQQHNIDIFAEYYPDPLSRQRVLDFIAAATGEWADFKTSVRDGRVIDTTWANIRLADGTSIGIGQDITERKQAEAALRESELRFREMIAALPVAVYVVESSGLITHYNRRAVELWGREPLLRDPAARYCGSLRLYQLDGALLPHSESPMSEVLRTGIPAHNLEVIIERPDGSRVTVMVSIAALRNEQGELIGAINCFQDITARKQAEAEQARLFAQLQLLSRQLLQAQEAERRSIARELHDEIGQRLTGLGLLLSTPPLAPEQFLDAQAVVRDLIARLRNLSLDLRPTILDDLGLLPALVWLFERYTAQTNVSVRFEHRLQEDQRFDPDVETSAYRIIQEALTNVARHAGVRAVTVRLWTDADTFWVVVADQGGGFDPQAVDPRRSSGLTGMQERAALLGGSLTIEAGSAGGTRLTATLPLHSGGSRTQEQSP